VNKNKLTRNEFELCTVEINSLLFFNQSYDSNVNFAPGAVEEMAKGSSSIVEINAYTTVPAAPLSLEVFQAQGYLVGVI
jgi:hypothetical protein